MTGPLSAWIDGDPPCVRLCRAGPLGERPPTCDPGVERSGADERAHALVDPAPARCDGGSVQAEGDDMTARSHETARGDRAALSAFLGVAVLAGGNAIAIRVGLRELDPLWSAALRFLIASAVLALIMSAARLPWPRRAERRSAVVFGALGLAAPFALFYHALRTTQAGLAQTLLALVPLVTLLVAVGVHQERLTVAAVAGSLIAVAGVGVATWRADPAPIAPITPPNLLAILGAVLAMAVAAVVVRRFPPVHPVAMNAVAVIVAAALFVVGAVVAGEDLVLPATGDTWAAVLYLAVVGSVGVFSLHLLVLAHWSASRANFVMVVIPVFAIPLSAWIDDEPVTAGLLVGAALIIAGVYLGALRRSAAAREIRR
jgi:drug/metabolite transporter (DMT)-like permease